jgi:hypothetical protein
MSNLGEEIIRRHNARVKKKSAWLNLWQILGEYVRMLKQDFTGSTGPGDMLNKEIFDATGPDAAEKCTAALIGLLWQSGSRSFLLQPPKSLKESAATKKYYDSINEITRDAFDDPRAGYATADEEYMNDQVAFGTSAIVTFEGTDSDVSFEAWGVDEAAHSLGRGGRLESISREVCWPLRRVIETYGVEKLSNKLQELARNKTDLDKDIKIIHALEPRENLKPGGMGNLNMAIRSAHVELDTKHVILESGYAEMPASLGLFYKRRKEDYGRSLAMKALPTILELNATKELRLLALEKAYDPPHVVNSDSIAGNQKLDMSAGGVIVAKMTKLSGGQPIYPLYDGANIPLADKQVEELRSEINGHFLLDRLIDFNNDTEMTLGEVQFRAELRGQSLGSTFHRQILVRQETIERVVNILFRKGRFGVVEGSLEHRVAVANGEDPLIIPDAIAKLIQSGKDFYTIKFLSPAARLMEAAEANGVVRTWQAAAQIAAAEGHGEVYDGLDADKSLEVISRNAGAPTSIMKAKEEIEAIRKERAQIIEQREQMQAAQQVADVAATAGQVPAA